jgi:hypothetical protein
LTEIGTGNSQISFPNSSLNNPSEITQGIILKQILDKNATPMNNSQQPSESVNKMLNHLNQHKYLNKVKSHDKNKLFLHNFRDNIKKIDNITNKKLLRSE